MYKLVLLRHGQTDYNLEKRFTGWTESELTKLGIEEAMRAGRLLLKSGYLFDEVHTNMHRRSILTAWTVLQEMHLEWVSVFKSWRLNERHYGDLQGHTHESLSEMFGQEQVESWRRSYDDPPPLLKPDDPRNSKYDPRYKGIDESLIPTGESVKMTLERTLPYWEEVIKPSIIAGRLVLVCASHNSLRALVKHLMNLSDDEIVKFTMPTGVPHVFTLNDDLRSGDFELLNSTEQG